MARILLSIQIDIKFVCVNNFKLVLGGGGHLLLIRDAMSNLTMLEICFLSKSLVG